MSKQIIILIVISLVKKCSFESYCNIPKECDEVSMRRFHKDSEVKYIRCNLISGSRLRFDNSLDQEQLNEKDKKCKYFRMNTPVQLTIRPKSERSIKLEKGMIDLRDLTQAFYINTFNILNIDFHFFKGFDFNLFDVDANVNLNQNNRIIVFLYYCDLNFYLENRKISNSCQDFNSINPKSIFQFFTKLRNNGLQIYLTESNSRICPLVFKNFETPQLNLIGENSFFSKKTLSFSNESFPDLNSTINWLFIYIENFDLDTNFLHPDVFKHLKLILVDGKVRKIHPEIFTKLSNINSIYLNNRYLKNLMHTNGIEWIRNYNKNVSIDIETNQIHGYSKNNAKYIYLDCFNSYRSNPVTDLFPDEDFCLYKDFPINNLVLIFENCPIELEVHNEKFSCTYLWLTRSYNLSIDLFEPSSHNYRIMSLLLSSDSYKSRSMCNFTSRLKLCNKSNFQPKSVVTIFEISEAFTMTEVVINILSYILSIFGLVTNLLVIKTISSKTNEKSFKPYKQYDYFRLNSICNCSILLINLISWLNHCVYPFQVFCPVIRKSVFMQYFNIVFEDILITMLRFMNNFTYVAFAFNRISLIGKDHNKLVTFMSELSVVKYISGSLFISVCLSIIKLFDHEINSGIPHSSYPLSYEYSSLFLFQNVNPAIYILNLISDVMNYFVFLFVNLAIDVGMIVKLRRTLNEKLEKSKEYSTKAQQEKFRKENEIALHNARSMIITNTSLNLLLKLPSFFNPIMNVIHLYYYKDHPDRVIDFMKFYYDICTLSFLCETVKKSANLLYIIFFSIQFFFYKHFDKKFSEAFKSKPGNEEKNKK